MGNAPKPHFATLLYGVAIIIVALFAYHLLLGKK